MSFREMHVGHDSTVSIWALRLSVCLALAATPPPAYADLVSDWCPFRDMQKEADLQVIAVVELVSCEDADLPIAERMMRRQLRYRAVVYPLHVFKGQSEKVDSRNAERWAIEVRFTSRSAWTTSTRLVPRFAILPGSTYLMYLKKRADGLYALVHPRVGAIPLASYGGARPARPPGSIAKEFARTLRDKRMSADLRQRLLRTLMNSDLPEEVKADLTRAYAASMYKGKAGTLTAKLTVTRVRLMVGDALGVTIQFRNASPLPVEMQPHADRQQKGSPLFLVRRPDGTSVQLVLRSVADGFVVRGMTQVEAGEFLGVTDDGTRALFDTPGVYTLRAALWDSKGGEVTTEPVDIDVRPRGDAVAMSLAAVRMLCDRARLHEVLGRWPSDRALEVAQEAQALYAGYPRGRNGWRVAGVLFVKATAISLHGQYGEGKGDREAAYKNRVYTDARQTLEAILDRSVYAAEREEAFFWGSLLCLYARESRQAGAMCRSLLAQFPASVYTPDARAVMALEEVKRAQPKRASGNALGDF